MFYLLACLLALICLLPVFHKQRLAFSINLHTSMITLYDLANLQNKAQKAWEKIDKEKMEEVSV
jgi:hypothetical protein